MDGWATQLPSSASTRRALTPEQALAIRSDERLRVEDDPYLQNLVWLSEQGSDQAFGARLEGQIRWKLLRHIQAGDPFAANVPAKGTLRRTASASAPIMRLANGDILSLPLGSGGTDLGVMLVGHIGTGKTSLMRILLLAYSGSAIILAFDRKGDLRRLASYEQRGEVVVLDSSRDVHLSLSDGIDLMGPEEQISQVSGLLSEYLSLRASRRLLTAIMHEGFGAEGPRGLTLSRLIARLEGIDAARTSQLGGHRDGLLFALRDLKARSGSVFDHETSNFTERLLAKPRTFVIGTGNLAPEHMSLMGSFIYRFIYESRRIKNISTPPVIIALDDAMALVTGTTSSESEGRTRPIATWATLGRSLGIGLMVAGQSFSQISPLLRQNTDNLIALGSYGADAHAIARHMGLNAEQAAAIPRLRPGMGVALTRSVWPLPLLGAIPELAS